MEVLTRALIDHPILCSFSFSYSYLLASLYWACEIQHAMIDSLFLFLIHCISLFFVLVRHQSFLSLINYIFLTFISFLLHFLLFFLSFFLLSLLLPFNNCVMHHVFHCLLNFNDHNSHSSIPSNTLKNKIELSLTNNKYKVRSWLSWLISELFSLKKNEGEGTLWYVHGQESWKRKLFICIFRFHQRALLLHFGMHRCVCDQQKILQISIAI